MMMISTTVSTPIDTDTYDNDDESPTKPEFDIDQATSLKELQTLLLDIEGPSLPGDLSLSEARDFVWNYVEESSPGIEDIDDMCLGQLSALAQEVVPDGEEVVLPENDDLDVVREFVRDLVDWAAQTAAVAAQVDDEDGSSCSCCGSK